MSNIKIIQTNIKLVIDDKEILLSIDDAKKLKSQLDAIFNDSIYSTYPTYPTYPTCPTCPTYTVYPTYPDIVYYTFTGL